MFGVLVFLALTVALALTNKYSYCYSRRYNGILIAAFITRKQETLYFLFSSYEYHDDWGEPERAPHKRDGCSQTIIIMVRTSPARRYMHCTQCAIYSGGRMKKLLRSRVPRASTCSLVARPLLRSAGKGSITST